MSTLWERLIEQSKQLNELMRESGEVALKERFKEIFDKNPEVEAFRWEQYVPAFNDGDPCVFTLTEVRMKLFNKPDEIYDEEGWVNLWDCYKYETDSQGRMTDRVWLLEVGKTLGELEKELTSNEKVLEIAFGANVEVTVDRNTITIEEYNCGF